MAEDEMLRAAAVRLRDAAQAIVDINAEDDGSLMPRGTWIAQSLKLSTALKAMREAIAEATGVAYEPPPRWVGRPERLKAEKQRGPV